MVSVRQGQELPMSICILVNFVLAMLVSSFTNWNLNDSNKSSKDNFTSEGRGYVKVSN